MKIIQLIFTILTLLQISQIKAKNLYLERLVNLKQNHIIAGSMDVKENPCNDFHQYACGNWKQVFSEAGTNYNNTIEMLDYNVNKEMSDIFKNFSTDNKPKFIKEAYKYYKSCVNLQGYEPNMYLMWFMENENNKQDWLKTLAKMRRYGLNNIFIEQTSSSKLNDSRTFYLHLDKANFEALTFDFLKTIVKYLDITDDDDLSKLWLKIQEFEKNLQELDEIKDIELANEEDYESKHFMAVKDIPLDWLKDYVKIILNQTELQPEMKLFLSNVPYMTALEELLKKYDQDFLSYYLEIRFLVYLLLEEPFDFNAVKCLANTRRLIPLAMHWLYEQQHPELLQEFENIFKIFNNVRNEFENTLKENKYKFTTREIEFLLNKLNSMQLRYNNIPRLNTMGTLETFYETLNLNADKLYENHLKVQLFNFQTHIDRINNNKVILDQTYLQKYEDISEPFYLRNANILVIPLTLLQLPIYNAALVDTYKYSTMGFLLAKELFHGFDIDGLSFGSNGNWKPNYFQQNPLFNSSLKCFQDANNEIEKQKISHTSGLRYAYKTYASLNPNTLNGTFVMNGKVMTLSNVFFLNFAQTFCEISYKPVKVEYLTDAIMNFPIFSETFDCRTNHLMYSHDICHLW